MVWFLQQQAYQPFPMKLISNKSEKEPNGQKLVPVFIVEPIDKLVFYLKKNYTFILLLTTLEESA